MGFKEAIKAYGKEITASFSYNGATFSGEDIISMNPHFEGSLLSSVMKCLDIELDHEALDEKKTGAIAGLAVVGETIASGDADEATITDARFGVKAPGDTGYSFVDYGKYIVKEAKKDEEQQTLSLECYDLMILSMIPYDIAPDYSAGITVKGLLDAVCDRLGWEKGYTTFRNSDVLIDGEKYDSMDTFRDVLDDIAEASGSMIGFVGNKLCVIYPTDNGEVIDEENLKSLKLGKKYGPINSVVLSRTPQEDNIYSQDSDSISTHGITEIRIENNQIIDSHREDFIDGICEAIFGLSFTLYELDSFGIGYLSLGELFTLQTLNGEEHKALMLCDDLQITQGVSETSRLEAPEVTETDYKAASETDKAINKTILRVDKQAQEITALASKTETIGSAVDGLESKVTHMTELMIDSDSVDIKISEAIEGIDSVKTSTGYTFDKEGLKISKEGEAMENRLDNTGMYVTRDGEEILGANHEGVTAINLSSKQYLIVGDNSRFENYDNGTGSKRTACFYIGG